MNGVAYAVVRFDPPGVYLAEDIDVLQRLLALELVADTDPALLTPEGAAELTPFSIEGDRPPCPEHPDETTSPAIRRTTNR